MGGLQKNTSLLGGPPSIKLRDMRKVDAASGLPITDKNRKDVNVNPDYITKIVREAKTQGVDPYTALAMAHQETDLSDKDSNPFHLSNPKTGDSIKEGISFLKDKLDYAQRLGKKTEPEQIQAYNGYGKLGKIVETGDDAVNMHKWYGVDVSKTPIDLNKNPMYGKRVVDLRDNVLKRNPDIVKIVETENNNGVLPAPYKRPEQDQLGLGATKLLGF